MEVVPFQINIPARELNRIRLAVRHYPWPEPLALQPGEDAWAYGTDQHYLRELCAYWVDGFDWRAQEQRLNRFAQLKARVEDVDIHFYHVRAGRPEARTVLLTHGWPGSVFEFDAVIEPLTCPERFGGSANQAVNVVVPSLVGFGFSSRPSRPTGPRRIAALWDKLMREVLGYTSYVAQGGDWGSVVSAHLGASHSVAQGGGCEAVHVNMCGVLPSEAPVTTEELAWLEAERRLFEAEGAYIYVQHTKPQSLAFAMLDSPVGQAAWILEKMHRWSDRAGAHPSGVENAFTKDQILTNIMIYVVTGTFGTASWIYRALFDEGSRTFNPGSRVRVPVGMTVAAREFMVWPPRSYLEKAYNITCWSQTERGGHFLAMEQPELFVRELQAFMDDLPGD